MQEIHLNTIQDFNDYNGMDTLHPLVSVIRVDNTEHIKEYMMHYGFYAIYLKENKGCKLSYGYFGTLVKTETGRTAKDLINDRILAKAKELLSISSPKGGGGRGPLSASALALSTHNTSSASSRLLQERLLRNGGQHNSMSITNTI